MSMATRRPRRACSNWNQSKNRTRRRKTPQPRQQTSTWSPRPRGTQAQLGSEINRGPSKGYRIRRVRSGQAATAEAGAMTWLYAPGNWDVLSPPPGDPYRSLH